RTADDELPAREPELHPIGHQPSPRVHARRLAAGPPSIYRSPAWAARWLKWGACTMGGGPPARRIPHSRGLWWHCARIPPRRRDWEGCGHPARGTWSRCESGSRQPPSLGPGRGKSRTVLPSSAFDGVTLLEVVQRSAHHGLRLSVDHRREGERRLRIELRAGALVDVDGLGAGRAG